MKKLLLFVLAMVPCFTAVRGENGGQIIAAQYGEFQVIGSSAGGFSFPPATCQVSGGGKNFAAFSAGTPIKIVDSNPNLTEVATPSSVYIGACSLNMATVYTHVPPFYLTSGTGGLQEAINANQTNDGPNTIVLTAEWYKLISPGNAASIIAAVHGIPDLGLEDVTTTPSTFYQWNGSQYAQVGGTASNVTYNQGGTGAVTRTSTAKWQDSISIRDFGAIGNGSSMSADTAGLQAAVAAAAITGQKVYIPAGTYLLNNSSTPALSGAKSVFIYGDGPSSVLSCQTVGGQDCIASTAATGFGLKDLAINFGPTATTRSSGYALNVQSCTSCTFDGISLNNGDLSGMRLASSVGTQIHNLKISNFFANGLFAINNQDLRVDGESCYNNQDACFEVSWFDSQFTANAIPCQNITASNITSNQDTEAILVNACNNVSVNGFTVLNSGKEAVFIGQDPTTTTAHWPDRISISNGTIYGSGYGSNANNTSTAQALYFNVGTSPGSFISHVVVSNVTATHISGWGMQMAELNDIDVNLANASFYDVGNGNNVGCLQTEGNRINLDAVSCSKVGTYGLYDQNSNSLTGTGLQISGASQNSGINAIYLATTATGFVNLTNVGINDTNATTFSSQVFDASTTGSHSIWNIAITYVTASGYLGPTSANGATTYTYTDPGHSMVFRNGGMIQSFVPPNYYFLPTAGATPSSYVNGAVLYYQSKCWASGAQQTESVGWLDQYPTLSTESFSFNQFGGCGFPITIDMTAATTIEEPQTNVGGTMSAKHVGGFSAGTHASVPAATAGSGAGTGPTISLDAQNNDVSGYISVTPGTSPAASAAVVTMTFGTAYATHAKCGLQAANQASGLLTGAADVFVPLPSTTAFVIDSGTTPLVAGTLYTWEYTCTQ